jgi:hypothetical protein
MESIVQIASIAVLVLALAIIVWGIVFGLRKGTYKSLVNLSKTLVSILLALFFAVVLSYVFSVFVTFPENLAGKILHPDIIAASPSLILLIDEIIRVVFSFVLFIILFFVIKAVLIIPEKRINNFLSAKPKPKGDRIWGVALSLVTAFALIVVFFFPVAGGIGLIDEVTENLVANNNSEDESFRTVAEIRDKAITPLTKNVVFAVSNTLGKPLFNTLMTVNVGGTSSTLNGELLALSRLFADINPLLSEGIENYGEKQVKALENAAFTLEDATLLCKISSEMISAAATAFNSQGEFAGIKLSDEIKNNFIIKELIATLSATDQNAVKSDVNNAVKLLEVFSKNNAFDMFSENADEMGILSRKGFIAGVVETTYAYPRFRAITAGIINTAFDGAAKSVGADPASFIIKKENLPELSESQLRTESELLENAANYMINFVDSLNGNDILDSDFALMGKALDTATQSRILGGKIKEFVEVFLKSEKVMANSIFTEEAINKILAADGGYENLFVSVVKTVNFAKTVSDKDSSSSDIIVWFAENTDKSTADIISSFITPDLMADYGIEGDASHKMAEVMSSYITELGNASGMAKEEAEIESKCVTYIYTIAETSKGGGEPLFGSDIPSAGELVNTFMETTVFSQTIEDVVYEDDTPTADPFGVGDYISGDDRQELIDALGDYVKENAGSQDEEELKRKAVSMASLIGADISGIVDGWLNG